MALGISSIGKMMDHLEKIKGAIKYGDVYSECVYSTWNTFNYVAKNLSVWADETTIGANVKQNVNQLSDALKILMDSTEKLNKKMDEFITYQKSLNGVSTESQF